MRVVAKVRDLKCGIPYSQRQNEAAGIEEMRRRFSHSGSLLLWVEAIIPWSRMLHSATLQDLGLVGARGAGTEQALQASAHFKERTFEPFQSLYF